MQENIQREINDVFCISSLLVHPHGDIDDITDCDSINSNFEEVNSKDQVHAMQKGKVEPTNLMEQVLQFHAGAVSITVSGLHQPPQRRHFKGNLQWNFFLSAPVN